MKLAHAHHEQLVVATFHAPARPSEEGEGSGNVLRSAAILSALMLALALLVTTAAESRQRVPTMAETLASDR